MSVTSRTFVMVFLCALFLFSAIISYADNDQSGRFVKQAYQENNSPTDFQSQSVAGFSRAADDCADINNDGAVNILDIIYLIDYKFKNGPVPECTECNCNDGLDNDEDGFIDCEDVDCANTPSCPETDCGDGVDNDGDGFTDCDDFDCAEVEPCIEVNCNDGTDNDGDGFTDCDDLDCADIEPCIETTCNDGVDNDGDGFTDCDDFDCAGDPDCL